MVAITERHADFNLRIGQNVDPIATGELAVLVRNATPTSPDAGSPISVKLLEHQEPKKCAPSHPYNVRTVSRVLKLNSKVSASVQFVEGNSGVERIIS